MTPFTVSVPDPGCGFLTANQRLHWRPRADATRQWRDAAKWWWRSVRGPSFEVPVRVVAVLRFHDRRRRDPANWHPTVKAVLDGFVDAGAVPDDSADWVVGPDLRLGDPLPRSERLRIEFVVAPLGGREGWAA